MNGPMGTTDDSGADRERIIGLRRPDKPVRELCVEAGDLRVEGRGVRVGQNPSRLALGAVVIDDDTIGDQVEVPRGKRPNTPVVKLRDRELLGRSRIGDRPNLGESSEKRRGPERRRWPRAKLIGGSEEEGSSAVETANNRRGCRHRVPWSTGGTPGFVTK